MTTGRRITQKDVAIAAGIDQSTVSLALRNHPRIPEETRQRVVAAAERLGYVPDPMLSALANYRTVRHTAKFRGSLAWLADSRTGLQWRENRYMRGFHAGAVTHAATLGFRVEILDLADLNVDWDRAAGIAHSRGVHGLLVCPQPEPNSNLDAFPWSRFSAVAFGHTLVSPQLNTVSTGYFDGMTKIMEELRLRDYRRIGLAIRPVHDRRTGHCHTGAYLASYHRWGQAPVVPICPDDGIDSDGKVLRAWLAKHRPDVLICGANTEAVELLTGWGMDVPGDLGVVCPVLPDGQETLSGTREAIGEIGRTAVDLLSAMIRRGEKGIPAHPRRVTVHAIWKPGQTLRPRLDTASPAPRSSV